MDWHEVAIGCIGMIVAGGGWVWMRTVAQLDRLDQRLTEHLESDRIEFGKVYERMFQKVRGLDARVDERFISSDRP